MIARLLTIAGRVQGVGYRDWAVKQALRLGLRGWVRNRPDGSVQALVAGQGAAVQAMAEACRRGPLLARVASVTEAPAEPPAEEGFARRADG
ncbi:acylphosphatase [Falsiroseomonas tokyonensis]|uniref:acylphosphatase n=1 Tax=Falsiroseomonas tokyonensis TaxID=430521 RepID=A0ABV7C044_9PROT|nr:acylphosphatase [Falsiroseomonas tokyonensis]MBU8539820.1 acylphosphatase [Falsiroseomonas tokyonensis]